MAGLFTFLFTDIEGSSSLWEHAPGAMREALESHDGIVHAGVEAYEGRVVKKTGDGFLAVFTSPHNAAAAALALQQALTAANWPPQTGPLKVRMGLHTGESQERDGDYFGSAVNIAARIMDLGHGGQILLSEVTVMFLRGQMPAEVTFTEIGVHELRGLAHAELIYQLNHPDLLVEFPPLRSPAVIKHNLPEQLASFVGRQREIAEIQELLNAGRLVTLTGPGGTGKTRLGLQVAAAQLGQYADGVYFVPLVTADDAAQVPRVLAQVFGIIERPHESLSETLQGYFRDQQMLLVLDNFEHVLDAAPLVTTLLQASTQLSVLATSREALRLTSEQEYQVPPLALPDATQMATLSGLEAVESVALFVQRAQAVLPRFTATQENIAAIAAVCRRLDGLPLAIELAAARIKLFGPQQLLERLQNRLGLLVGGSRDLPNRQRTLRDAIDWSYHLLDEAERRLFARLAVFSGGRTLEAVEAVCGFEPVNDPLLGLESLLDKSLFFQREGPSGEPRFYMLETIGEYARERLTQGGEEEIMRRRHAHYFLAQAETAEPQLRLADQVDWMARLESEHDNLRAALAWLLSHDPHSGLRLAAAIGHFWHVHGHHSEGREWLARLLRTAADDAGSRALRAKALNTLSMLAWYQGEQKAALVYQEEGVKLWQAVGDVGDGLAMAKRNLAMAQFAAGDLSLAHRTIEESVLLFKNTGNAAWADDALFFQGYFAYVDGDLDFAQAKAHEALKIAQTLGDVVGLAAAYSLLGHVAFEQGDATRAQVYYEKSLYYFRAAGDLFGTNVLLASLANVYHLMGDYDLEKSLLLEYLLKSRTIANKGQVTYALSRLGLVSLFLDQDAQARDFFDRCLPLCLELEDLGGESTAECLSGLALLLVKEDKPAQAAQLLGYVQQYLEESGDLETIFISAYDQVLAEVKTRPEEVMFMSNMAAGKAMSVDQAIQYAAEIVTVLNEAPNEFGA